MSVAPADVIGQTERAWDPETGFGKEWILKRPDLDFEVRIVETVVHRSKGVKMTRFLWEVTFSDKVKRGVTFNLTAAEWAAYDTLIGVPVGVR